MQEIIDSRFHAVCVVALAAGAPPDLALGDLRAAAQAALVTLQSVTGPA